MSLQTQFVIRVVDAPDSLTIELTSTEQGHMWMGKFDKDSIENLTKKTGSAKKYPVFIKMLHSALDQSSESVIVDILTPRDLELLRDRRQRESQIHGGDNVVSGKLDDSKMFLILTYLCEFEKVHYPLCLSKSVPKEQQLLQTINALRQELAATKSQSTANNSMLGSLAPFGTSQLVESTPHKSPPAHSSVLQPAASPTALESFVATQHEQHKQELAALFKKIDLLEREVQAREQTIRMQTVEIDELRQSLERERAGRVQTDVREGQAGRRGTAATAAGGSRQKTPLRSASRERSGSNSQYSNSGKKPRLPLTKTYNYQAAKPKLPTAPSTKPGGRLPTPKKAAPQRTSPTAAKRHIGGYLPQLRRSQDSFNSRDSGEMRPYKGGSKQGSRSNSVSSLSNKGLNTSNGSLKKPNHAPFRNSPKPTGLRQNSPNAKRSGSPFRFQDTREIFRSHHTDNRESDVSDSRERRRRARQVKEIDTFHLNRPIIQTQTPKPTKSALKHTASNYNTAVQQQNEEIDQDLLEIHQKYEKLSKVLAAGAGKH